MQNNNHPITPPPELVREWFSEFFGLEVKGDLADSDYTATGYVTTKAARWGADTELEACCEWVAQWCGRSPDGTRPEDELRAARRPKPPSLKEQALSALNAVVSGADDTREFYQDIETIRLALESLDD